MLCITNPGQGGGLRHHRASSLYTGVCKICKEEKGEDFCAVYTGETGFSGYTRTRQHRDDIIRKKEDNGFAKHLAEYHPAREGDAEAFQFSVERTFQKPMERQVSEAVAIHTCKAALVLNSKSEWEQPVTERVVMTREPQESQPAGRGRGRGRGVRGRGRREVGS